MQREHILKIFGKGFLYALFGNILSGIMIISIAPMISVWFICLVAFLFTLFIYASLLFTAGYRDGQREQLMLKNHRVEAIPKYRWLALGAINGGIMAIPTIVILLSKLGLFAISGEFMFAYRFINGTVYPLFHIMGVQSGGVEDFPIALLIGCILFYVVISPIAAHIGYKFGTDENLKQKFMYER